MIKESPQEAKEWSIKVLFSKSVIKLVLNTYIIKKRVYKRKREARKASKHIKKL
jgi:hypothetical protein